MTGKLKRYISLDILRGLAIIAVFSFHILNYAFDKNAAIADPGIGAYIFMILLVFLAEFDVLFTCLSALVNTISIDRKWNRMMSEWEGDPKEGRKHVFRSILKIQLIRGLFIVLCAYVAEVLLNHMLLQTIMGLPDVIAEGINMLFRSHILWLIGVGLIITSISYLLMKRADWSKKKMIITLIVTSLCTLLIVTPFLQWLYPALGFPHKPQDLWLSTNWGTNILRIFLAPIIKDDFPLFPDVSIMFIGVVIGFLISGEQVEKKTLNRLFLSSIVLFVVGAGVYLLEGELYLILESFSDPVKAINVKAGEYLMTSGGAILAIIIFLYLIDIRRGRKEVKFFYFQRFGTVSLTLWMLQWVMVFPLGLLNLIINWITGSTTALRDGLLFQKGLNGYGVIGEILYIIAFWSIVLWLWQKINFVGSFEWMTVKLMGGKRGHERAKISDAIVNAESLSDPPQKYYKWYMIVLFFFVFLAFCVLFLYLTELL